MGWQLGVHEGVRIEILNGTQVRHLDVFIDFLISHSNAHLCSTRNDKDLCDVVWVDQNSALTSVHTGEILRIALVTALGWCPLRVIVLCYSTNVTSSVGNINRLWTVRPQSTGTIYTSVCTSVRNLLVMERTYYIYMYLQHG